MATTTPLIRTPNSRPTSLATEVSPNVHPPPVVPSHPASPGTWRHPKFTEIVKRQSASTFSDRNLQRALLNALALLLTFFFSSPVSTAINTISSTLTLSTTSPPDTSTITSTITSTTITFYTLLATRLFLLYNLIYALLPLKSKDSITDIPLTPSQRSLLGLDPSIPSATTSSPFITPPRYRRSSSSSSFSPASASANTTTPDRRSISATYFSSPLSASRFSPTSAFSPFRSPTHSRGNGSPFSPSASPLLQKAIAAKQNSINNQTTEPDRRRSLGTPGSALGRSQSLRERGARVSGGRESGPESPSPSPVGGGGGGGARRNPHLNYKWLYEKGGRLPKSETMQF